MTDLRGILPSTKSRVFIPRSDPWYEILAGNRDPYPTCGRWMSRGCLEYSAHGHVSRGQKDLTGGDAERVGVVQRYKASCGRLDCPVCYEKACAKEAARIEHRIRGFKSSRFRKAIHVVVSVSDRDAEIMNFLDLRDKAREFARYCGLIGGCMIWHPFRRYSEDDFKEDLEAGFSHKKAPAAWYWSPHFHFIGYGWIDGERVKRVYREHGWIVKNLGIRKSVRATAHYQLSHCGVAPRVNGRLKYHTVVWFGVLAYNKLKVGKVPPLKHLCTICGKEMRKVEPMSAEAALLVKSTMSEEGVYYVKEGVFRYSNGRARDLGGGFG